MKIKIEGSAEIGTNQFYCVCGHCGNTDRENALMEFNFQEQRVIYVCGKCKKENSMNFGKEKPRPYPSLGISR